jgi:hypothetical protein
MTSLGSLGRRKQPVDLDFDWFGHTIRVAPTASDLVEIEFLGQASLIDLEAVDLNAQLDAQALAKMGAAAAAASNVAIGSVKKLIHPDDWATFWKAAVDNGQDLADLMEVQKAISAAVTEARSGFPTGRPSDSSDGPATTPESSAADSSSPAAPTRSLPAGLSDADQTLAMLRGRPDLQEFVVMQEEAERKRAAAVG